MAFPIVGIIVATAAGFFGIRKGIKGGEKIKDADDTMKSAQRIQEKAIQLFNKNKDKCTDIMDEIGKKELKILKSFDDFSDLIEKIQGRPQFKKYSKNGIILPEYKAEELKKVSTGAGILLSGLGGAVAGTAGGFASAGATTSAIMALGTASTGTSISSLGGAAATNATLAALGGGSLASGGGGVALGSAILGGASLGVAFLIGGIIIDKTGNTLSKKADEAYHQANRTKNKVNIICKYLNELTASGILFQKALDRVEREYNQRLTKLDSIVNNSKIVSWSDLSEDEKKVTENLILLVGLLYKMCKTNLVIRDECLNNESLNPDNNRLNHINNDGILKIRLEADHIINRELNKLELF